jgi:hypothetical protein
MEFCRIWMPYCLAKVEDEHGGWIPLNRFYKPLGHVSGEWVDYCSVPPGSRIKRLLPETAAFLSWNGEGTKEGRIVFLYNDGSFPVRSSSHWNSYSEKLARLARLMIEGR